MKVFFKLGFHVLQLSLVTLKMPVVLNRLLTTQSLKQSFFETWKIVFPPLSVFLADVWSMSVFDLELLGRQMDCVQSALLMVPSSLTFSWQVDSFGLSHVALRLGTSSETSESDIAVATTEGRRRVFRADAGRLERRPSLKGVQHRRRQPVEDGLL